MKKRITKQQWDELSKKQRLALATFMGEELVNPDDIDKIFYLPSIGTMIDFLSGNSKHTVNSIIDSLGDMGSIEVSDLCDELFKALKERLSQ